MSLPETYTVAEVAAALRCSQWLVRAHVKRGTMRPIRLGSKGPMRFTDADVAALRKALTPAPPAPRRRKRRAA